MAEARLLSKTVATDKRLNTLSQDAMLLYLMAIPHLDRDGIIDGRPRIVWAMAAPLQDDMMARAGDLIDEWVESGLVVRYGDERQPVLFFPGFARNQPRMVYQRERESRFPCPPGYERTPSGLVQITDTAARDEVATDSQVGRTRDDGNGTNARDDIATESRVSHTQTDSGATAARDEVATHSRLGRAEDQDQIKDQDQAEVQDQVSEGSRTCIITTPLDADRATAQHHQPRAQPRHRTSSSGSNGRIANGTVSAGEILHSFTDDQLRIACFKLGRALRLHHEWSGYEKWLARQPAGTLLALLEWIAFHRALPPDAMEHIESLTAVIRAKLHKGARAPLTGAQRRTLAEEIEAAVNAADGP